MHEKPLLSYSDFYAEYLKIKPFSPPLTEESGITINWREAFFNSFLSGVSKFRIPNLRKIIIEAIPKENKLFNCFLAHSLPKRIKRFYLNWHKENTISIQYYLSNILILCKYITERIVLWNFEITIDQIISIVGSTSHITESIDFVKCKILGDGKIKFPESLKLSCKELNLNLWGEISEWYSYPERFANLIQSFSQITDFSKTVKQLRLKKCGLTFDEIKEILRKNQLEEMELVARNNEFK